MPRPLPLRRHGPGFRKACAILWQRDDPALYETRKGRSRNAFPNLHFVEDGDFVYVRGIFPVMFEGQSSTAIPSNLQLARDHPIGLPVVREAGGRIPRHPDRHINDDGTACVLTSGRTVAALAERRASR